MAGQLQLTGEEVLFAASKKPKGLAFFLPEAFWILLGHAAMP